MHELKQEEEKHMHLSVNSSKENIEDIRNNTEINSMDDGQFEIQKQRMDANMVAGEADLKPNKSIIFPSQNIFMKAKKSALKR